MRILSTLLVLVLVTGCVSSSVRTGATIGAVSGAAAGAGVGLLISDENLLGSEDSPTGGDTSLATAETVAASALIGVVFGAIVGGMVGHVHEPQYGRELDQTDAEAEEPSPEGARAPALLRF